LLSPDAPLKKPDTPADEQVRLETLRSLGVLDTPAEERFDRLTRMAKRMFGVPIALVSLVDENRQWFKSCVGLAASETPRDISFCGHAILGAGVFIIPNTLEDPRFADNPLVSSDPKIRFYAGCPLSVNGHKLGTLCIIDQKARSFDQEDIEALKDLASMVEHELMAVSLATMDELTQVLNRRGFDSLAQHSLNLCSRQGIPATVAFIDLDKFKHINDNFGHAEGDRALVAFTVQMNGVIRDSDIFARLGGDEFVALLVNTAEQQAVTVIGRLQSALNEYNQESNRGYDIKFSFGIVEFDPGKPSAIGELLAQGDALMYGFKKAKR
jgi:diguanylate cyclase (GGDEF)-like protein